MPFFSHGHWASEAMSPPITALTALPAKPPAMPPLLPVRIARLVDSAWRGRRNAPSAQRGQSANLAPGSARAAHLELSAERRQTNATIAQLGRSFCAPIKFLGCRDFQSVWRCLSHGFVLKWENLVHPLRITPPPQTTRNHPAGKICFILGVPSSGFGVFSLVLLFTLVGGGHEQRVFQNELMMLLS